MSADVKAEIPEQAVGSTSPPAKRMNVAQQLALSSFWFATNLHWGALLLIMIPAQGKEIVPDNPAAASAWVFGVGSIMALIIPLVVGPLSDRSMSRFGRRRPFMVNGIFFNLIGLATMAYAVAHLNLPLYILGYVIVQFGNNSAGAAYAGIIPDMVPESQRGEASGYMATMTQAGMILGAFMSGKLLADHKDMLAFAVIAVVMVVFLLLTVFTVHETPLRTPPPPLTLRGFLNSLIEPLKYRDFFWVLVTRAFVTLGMWCVQPYIQNYLDDVIHVDSPPSAAGNLLAIILLAATITGLIGGKLSDHIGRKRVVYMANTLIAVCSIAFVFSHSLTYTFIIGALYGVGYGAYFSVDWALACDVLPNKDDAGKDMGIWHVAMVLPQTFAPALAGWMLGLIGKPTFTTHIDEITHHVTHIKHYALAGYQLAFATGAVFLLLGAILLRNVREPKEREAAATPAPHPAA